MTADENRKWRERALWCLAQADATEGALASRREYEPKTMAELSVGFLRDMAANIAKGLNE